MVIKDVKGTLLKVNHVVNKPESTKKFDFFVGSFVDEEANVFKVNLASRLTDTEEKVKALSEIVNASVKASFSFYPRRIGKDEVVGVQLLSFE